MLGMTPSDYERDSESRWEKDITKWFGEPFEHAGIREEGKVYVQLIRDYQKQMLEVDVDNQGVLESTL